MKKLTQQERAVWGKCPVCEADHGEPCDLKALGPVDFGAHRRRVQRAPATELPQMGESMTCTAMTDYYVNGLEKVKAAGPEWAPESRLMLIMATSLLMQSVFNAGVPYGAAGVPNMQSILELGGMTADELEAGRDSIIAGIDGMLLPYFRDGKLPDVVAAMQGQLSQVAMLQGFESAFTGGIEIGRGIKEVVKAGTATPAELELSAVLADAMELAEDIGLDIAGRVLALDEKRWPGAAEVKAALLQAAAMTGLKIQ